MPIYEYECRGCGEHFEIIQGFSDKPIKKCELCGDGLTKLISECSFHLKGSGWYVTDYGSSKRSASAPAENQTEKPVETKEKEKSANATTKSSEPVSYTPAKTSKPPAPSEKTN